MNTIKSMTGFGKGQFDDGKKCFTVEIKTVNNRYTDIIIKAPKLLRSFDDTIRKLLKNSISRGRVELYINVDYVADSEIEIEPNLELLKSYTNAINEIKKVLETDKSPDIDTYLKFQDILLVKRKENEEEEILNSLTNAVNNSLEKLTEMRIKEGQELKKDILEKTNQILEYIKEIKKQSDNIVEEYRKKLETRINELLNEKFELDENRLYNEIVFYADKSDINEEIVRLNSHIEQIYSTLDNGGVIGRKLDFIIQESNREINTIGSKIGKLDIIKSVIEVKNLLEKIREQIQNIE